METESSTNLVGVAVAILVAVMMLGTILVPVIYDSTHTTVSVTNEGAGELRLAYYEEPTAYSITASASSPNITVGTQTIAEADTICWASDVGTVLYSDGSYRLVADDNGTATLTDLGTSCSIVADAEGNVTVADADDTVYTGTVTWSYAPDSAGTFAFYTDTEKTIGAFPFAAAGLFVGIGTYNDLSSDDRFELDSTVTDGVVEEVSWVEVTE